MLLDRLVSGCRCQRPGQHVTSEVLGLENSVEVAHLASGKDVLAGARAVLADEKAGEYAVRSALTRATESLEDVIRIAVSRGGRLLERDG
ncbi:hypothetical protein ACGFZQ_26580 [Streptomyces sp. NPDC048254]|uniref:hypothetical protein n=1 Tax=Streptomyces sp. NPDC048254 TaxID=3365525 RepID=UPI0037245C32